MENKLLSLKEVQELLMVSYSTLNHYIKDGKISIVKISPTKRYIREQDLENFLKEHTGVYKG